MNELEYVTYDEHGRVQFGSVHDDGLDLISQLALMNIYTPSEDMVALSNKYKDPMWYDSEPDINYTNSYIV